MALDVMSVIEGVVRRPMRTWFGEFQDGGNERIIFGKQLHSRNDFHFRSLWQFGAWWQNHHAILDCAFETHLDCLVEDAFQCKPN